MNEAPTLVEVTQEDRERAAPILRLYGAENYALICEKGMKYCDGLAMLQAFAHHRLAAISAARPIIEAEMKERCAKVADEHSEKHFAQCAESDWDEDVYSTIGYHSARIATAIRNLGPQG